MVRLTCCKLNILIEESNNLRYNLTGLTPVGEWGTIRLRTRYLHDLIMPEEEYSPLKGLFLLLSLTTAAELVKFNFNAWFI